MEKKQANNSKIKYTLLSILFSILFIFTALYASDPIEAYADDDEATGGSSLTTNTPAPTVSTEATQPVQQAQPDKSARFKEKAENQASKVMAEIEKLQKLSNKKYYTYSTEQINELFGAIQSALDETKATFTTTNAEKKKLFTFSA